MRIAQVSQGISNVVKHLAAIIQVNNIAIINQEKTVSWHGRTPGIIKGCYYHLEYQHAIDNQQYSLLLSDGSFFQFHYEFESNDQLRKARLAFYPRPLSSSESVLELLDAADEALNREDDQLYEHIYNWTELLDIHNIHPSNTSHIRFDYDKNVVSHAPSHIQLSGVQEFRIPANFFPLPLAFVQLCESMISGINALNEESLGFERNNLLELQRRVELIVLKCGA